MKNIKSTREKITNWKFEWLYPPLSSPPPDSFIVGHKLKIWFHIVVGKKNAMICQKFHSLVKRLIFEGMKKFLFLAPKINFFKTWFHSSIPFFSDSIALAPQISKTSKKTSQQIYQTRTRTLLCTNGPKSWPKTFLLGNFYYKTLNIC